MSVAIVVLLLVGVLALGSTAVVFAWTHRPIKDEGTLRRLLEEADADLKRSNVGSARRRYRRVIDSVGSITPPNLVDVRGRAHLGLGMVEDGCGKLAAAIGEYRLAFGSIVLPTEASDKLAADVASCGDTSTLGLDIAVDYLTQHRDGPSIASVLAFLESLCRVTDGAPPANIGAIETLAARVVAADGRLGWAVRAQGLAAAGLGRAEEAISLLRRAEDLEPGDPRTSYELGVLYGASEQLDLAVGALRRSLLLNGKQPDALIRLAQAQVETIRRDGKDDPAVTDDAVGSLTAACVLAPTRADAWYLLGTLQRGRSRLEAALDSLATAARLIPTNAAYQMELATLSLDLGHADIAISAARLAMAADASNLAAPMLLGRTLLANGDLAGAEAAFRGALKLESANGPALQGLGRALFGQGRFPETEATIEQIPSPSIDDVILRGRALGLSGRHGDAMTWLEQHAAMAPNSAELWYRLGCERATLGDWVTSVTAFDRASASGLDESSAAEAKLFRAACLYSQGNLRAASASLKAAPAAADARHYFLQGRIATTKGDNAKAREAFTSAVGLDPNHVGAWMGLGLVAERLRDYDAASDAYANALALEPGNGRARARLGASQIKSGNTEVGFATLGPIIDDSAEATYYSGLAAAALGDNQRAVDLWGALRSTHPADDVLSGNLAEAEYLVGRAEFDKGDWAAAARDLSRSFEVQPHPDTAALLAESLVREGIGALLEPAGDGSERAYKAFADARAAASADSRPTRYLGLLALLREDPGEALNLLSAGSGPDESSVFLKALGHLEAGQPDAAAALLNHRSQPISSMAPSRIAALGLSYAMLGDWQASSDAHAAALAPPAPPNEGTSR